MLLMQRCQTGFHCSCNSGIKDLSYLLAPFLHQSQDHLQTQVSSFGRAAGCQPHRQKHSLENHCFIWTLTLDPFLILNQYLYFLKRTDFMFKVDSKNETRTATELSLWLLLFLCIIEGSLPYNIQQLLCCFGAIHGKCNWTELSSRGRLYRMIGQKFKRKWTWSGRDFRAGLTPVSVHSLCVRSTASSHVVVKHQGANRRRTH